MSSIEWSNRLSERVGDWLNPILIKETRQALKSKQFLAAFMALLVAAWLIAVFGMLQQGSALEYGTAGRDFFFLFYIALAAATLIVVPFGAFRSLQGERDFNTFELLSVTTLKPRQIVWGKLLSAVVQLLLFYSAITPFIAFSSLLQGFDVPRFALALFLLLLVSLLLSMAALMCSTISRQRVAQGMITIAVLLGLISAFSSSVGLVQGVISGGEILPITDWRFWLALGLVFVGGLSYFILFQQITTAQLTFESDNRSTGIRVTVFVQFVLLWVAYFGLRRYFKWTISLEELYVLITLSGIHWLVFGALMATEEDGLSRRVRRGLPRSRLLRLLLVPFLPGGGRGFLSLLLQTALLWWLVAGTAAVLGVSSWRWAYTRGSSPVMAQYGGEGLAKFVAGLLAGSPTAWNTDVQFVTGVCCYLLFYVGLGAALGRWGMALSHEVRPAHARVVTVLLILAGVIWPFVPRMADLMRWPGYSLIDVTSPPQTLAQLTERDAPQWTILILLWLGAAAGVLLNVRAMIRGVAEILGPSPQTAEDVPFVVLEES